MSENEHKLNLNKKILSKEAVIGKNHFLGLMRGIVNPPFVRFFYEKYLGKGR
jgi:hypothetical protein